MLGVDNCLYTAFLQVLLGLSVTFDVIHKHIDDIEFGGPSLLLVGGLQIGVRDDNSQ